MQPDLTLCSPQLAGPTNKTVTSDSDARYEASPVAAGIYTITVTAPGYQTAVINNVEIQTGVLKTVDIALTPAP